MTISEKCQQSKEPETQELSLEYDKKALEQLNANIDKLEEDLKKHQAKKTMKGRSDGPQMQDMMKMQAYKARRNVGMPQEQMMMKGDMDKRWKELEKELDTGVKIVSEIHNNKIQKITVL